MVLGDVGVLLPANRGSGRSLIVSWLCQALHGGETSLLAGMAMSNLGGVVAQLGDAEQAITWYQAALDAERQWLAPDAPPFLALLTNFAELLDTLGRSDEAEELAKEVIAALAPLPAPLAGRHSQSPVAFPQGG